MEVHIVQKGDTLWKISRQYGVSFDELKRVNGHLANPDYIVPGMKITIPMTPKKAAPATTPSIPTEKKMEKAPINVAPVKEKVAPPEQLRPIPETPAVPEVGGVVEKPAAPKAPKAPAAPKVTKAPKVQEAVKAEIQPIPEMPKVQQPMPQPIPEMPPVMGMQYQMPQPMQPMQPMQFFGVPCGWMPIYDADCFSYVHPNQMHPMPMPTPQMPVENENIPMKPAMPEMPMQQGWQMIESPNIQFEEDIKFKKMPNIQFEESPTIDVKATKKEIEPIEEVPVKAENKNIVEEENLQPYSMMTPEMGTYGQYEGYPAYPAYQAYPCGCGHHDCGCGQPYPMKQPCGCGQGQMPLQMPMNAPMPMYQQSVSPQHMNYCNSCNQPIQAMPYQNNMPNSPYPNWPGNY